MAPLCVLMRLLDEGLCVSDSSFLDLFFNQALTGPIQTSQARWSPFVYVCIRLYIRFLRFGTHSF